MTGPEPEWCSCPECGFLFRVDPARISPRGVRTRCTRCGAPFGLVARSGGLERVRLRGADGRQGAPDRAQVGGDPSSRQPAPSRLRARRMARVLVSDLLAYRGGEDDPRHLPVPALVERFGAEVQRSWEEFLRELPPGEESDAEFLFQEALDGLLAGGRRIPLALFLGKPVVPAR